MKRIIRKILVLLLLSFSACREQIIHNVSEYEANRLLSSLQEMSIDAAKEKNADGSWIISVPSDDALRAIKFVSDSRMVREPLTALASKSSLVMSRDEQRFAYERGLSREIETTLLSVPGVLEARVHLNIPSTDPLLERRSDNQKGSASVLLLIEAQRLVKREDIATLVSGASGISLAAVSVVVAEDAIRNTNQKEQMPLFAEQTTIKPEEIITSIPVSEAEKIKSESSVSSLKSFFNEWIKNFSPLRLIILAGLSVLLISLYLYARKLHRGTGLIK